MNLGLVPFIDMYTDPDAINQLIIRMVKNERRNETSTEIFLLVQCQQIPLTIENFLLVARTTDSRAELASLAERLDYEISRWRSKDTGGENGRFASIRDECRSTLFAFRRRHSSDAAELQLSQTFTFRTIGETSSNADLSSSFARFFFSTVELSFCPGRRRTAAESHLSRFALDGNPEQLQRTRLFSQ